jgi:Lrp/AsnC family transcriptional regulator, leucine-responsive regulatory protein
MRKKHAANYKSEKSTSAGRAPVAQLDSFDLAILAALKENGRMPNVQIAERIGLSEAPCSRRIRRLEQEGVIRGYTAVLEAEAIGVSFIGYVTLVLDYITGSTAQEFVDRIAEIPEVMSCYIVSGGFDAILHVAAKDSGAYSDIVFEKLRRIPGVKDVRSSFVMRTIKAHTGLPLLATGE